LGYSRMGGKERGWDGMVRRVENKCISESREKGEVKTRVEIRTKYRKWEWEEQGSESVDMLEYKRIETKTGVTIQRSAWKR